MWADVDFEAHNVIFAPKKASSHELAWQPKDHETRTIPIPRETVQLLANLQAESNEGTPYVFLTMDRLNHVVGRRAEGTWQSDFELVNNLTRDLEVMCRHAEVEYFPPMTFVARASPTGHGDCRSRPSSILPAIRASRQPGSTTWPYWKLTAPPLVRFSPSSRPQ